MPMVPFYTRLPKVAEEEFHSLSVESDPAIPDGEYGIIELYCDEPGCDCRRVFVQVIAPEDIYPGPLATINYGWEDAAFYFNWAHASDDPDYIEELMGPALAMAPQSPIAPGFLEIFKDFVQDPEFVDSLRRHYILFRQSVESEARKGGRKPRRRDKEVGPNRPCPCGSGKKFKKCCGRN